MKICQKLLILAALFAFLANYAAAQANRKVILEDITASWCGLCPEGIATSHLITNNFDNVIPVAIHIADPMQIPETAEIGDIYTGSGVNALLLDRYLFPDLQFIPFSFEYQPLAEKVEERLNTPAKVAIAIQNVSFDTLTRTLQATVCAKFIDLVSNYTDLRFNFWLVEDSIISSASGYAQTNFFSGVPGYFYSGAGNPIYNFPHRHVLRAAIGGIWGSEASLPLPNTIAIADSFSYNYTYTLPETWKLDKLSLIAIVQNHDSLNYHHNEILNAQDVSLFDALLPPSLPNDTTIVDTTTTITDTTTVITDTTTVDTTATYLYPTKHKQLLQIVPNPANNLAQIQYSITKQSDVYLAIYSLSGKKLQLLKHETQNAGNYALLWQNNALPAGVYLLGLLVNGQQTYTKFVVQR